MPWELDSDFTDSQHSPLLRSLWRYFHRPVWWSFIVARMEHWIVITDHWDRLSTEQWAWQLLVLRWWLGRSYRGHNEGRKWPSWGGRRGEIIGLFSGSPCPQSGLSCDRAESDCGAGCVWSGPAPRPSRPLIRSWYSTLEQGEQGEYHRPISRLYNGLSGLNSKCNQ